MDRRELLKLGTGAVVTGFASGATAAPANPANVRPESEEVAQWGLFEVSAQGPSAGNPFVDVQFGARFTFGHRTVDVTGFYDGSGVYKVRFSPNTVGRWSYETASNVKD